jgi:hypothetical protein
MNIPSILDTAKYRHALLDEISTFKSAATDGSGSISLSNFRTSIVRFTPVVDTSAYAAGDVLFDTTAVTLNSSASAPARGTILSAFVLDREDQAAQTVTLYFFDANVSLGTINSAPSITDDNASSIIGIATVTTGTDLGGCKVGESTGLVLPFLLPNNILYVAATTGGAPTFASASDIRVRLSVQMETAA